ncbi:MAG: hydantoinase B/oxoprolinase family protein [Thermoleophilia bacterium]
MNRIGVDVGGTFTDFVLRTDAGGIRLLKVPSTPADPSRATLDGAAELLAAAGLEPGDVGQFLHGTTVVTNIVLEHKGARAGLITTEGFRDVLHIARHKRPRNFSLHDEPPWQRWPLVPRALRLPVPERIAPPDGEVLVPLDEDAVRAAARRLRDEGVEAVSICFLFSFLDPTHEQRAAEIVREELPDAFVSTSHEVAPVYREYERFSTTALNAYAGPRASAYIAELADGLGRLGVAGELRLMQSDGGVTGGRSASERPVSLLMSGPVAGLVGGIWAGALDGFDSTITLDVGGTSADIGVAPGGRAKTRHLMDTRVGGYDVIVPMLDIETIGAGGGSIAHVDPGGMFTVGPESAGAAPGPAAYGRGGERPTTTDANLVLGRLLADRFLGGRMALHPERARAVVEAGVAGPLGLSVEEAALGAITILDHHMIQAIELNSVRRGYDPRDFALVAFGGAGPLHACEVARALRIPTVVVPPAPGITSAIGLLASDLSTSQGRTVFQLASGADTARLERELADLEADVVGRLVADGIAAERIVATREVDCRYVGQGYELRVPFPAGPVTAASLARIVAAYHEAHDREYGGRFDDMDVELVNVHVVGVAAGERLAWAELPEGGASPDAALLGSGPLVVDEGGRPLTVEARHYDRALLLAGNVVDGPALVVQEDSTTFLPPGFSARVSRSGNLVVSVPLAEDDRRAAPGREVDKVTERVIGGALDAIAKEMGSALWRMAFSSIIRESEDLGAGIFDARGRMLCESDQTPMQFGALSGNVRGILDLLGDDLHDGDVVIHNDPYRGASHSSDICVVTPIFWQGELVAFSANDAHWIDIGGGAPGYNEAALDLWAEGVHLPAVKLYERGALNAQVERLLFANVRTPSINRGDLRAQLASVELGKRRFLELLERYGKDVVLETADRWMDYAERRLREAIAAIPDGDYEAEGLMDDNGVDRDTPVRIRVTVRVRGDGLTIDLTGSHPENPSAFNAPFEGTTSVTAYYVVRTLLLDEVLVGQYVPQNDGIFRPVTVEAPLGCMFNPRFPRGCTSRFTQAQRLADLVIRALAPVLPQQATAGNSASCEAAAYAIFRPEREQYQVYVEINEGSYGGRLGRDGMDSVDCLVANTRNNPVEELESHYLIRTERYELRDDGCAPGRWRGGVGIVRENRFLADGFVSLQGDRHLEPPHGIFGGREGRVGSTTVNPGREDERSIPAKLAGLPMRAGDVIRIVTPSGGGYGDPFQRDPALVLRDVLDGLVTVEEAAAAYGVAVAGAAVDEAATARLRAAAAGPGQGPR